LQHPLGNAGREEQCHPEQDRAASHHYRGTTYRNYNLKTYSK
jgi:hypothetical protein